jgi:hypothetical protein
MRGLGWLAALWILSQVRSSGASSSPSSPSSPAPAPTPTPPGRIMTLPPIEDLDDSPDLLNPPPRSEIDEIWERYATDPKRPGPIIMAAELAPAEPVDRYLSEFERWALRPYFPVAADLDTKIHNGKAPAFMPAGIEMPKELWAATAHWPPGAKPEIWFPNGVRSLWKYWWLGVLAHELTHVSQIRIGSTPGQALDALLTYGYQDSPIERQARWMQRRVLNGLEARARAFYGQQKA